MATGDEQLKLLRELVNLTRVSVYPAAKELLRDTFFEGDEPRAKRVRVYANMRDGRPQTAIAEAAGVAQSSVSTWMREWQRSGIVSEKGRAVFDIYEFFPGLREQLDG